MSSLPSADTFVVQSPLLEVPRYSTASYWVDPRLDSAILSVLHDYNIRHFTTGSRVICDPPVEGTDLDVVLCVPEESCNVTAMLNALGALGFCTNTACGDREYGTTSNLRNGDVNLILTTPDQYELWKRATAVCTYLNVKDRETRVTIFKLIRN